MTLPRSSPSWSAAFPSFKARRERDICYATTNRQGAVKAIAYKCDVVLVIGAPNSSNSLRLRELAEREGARAYLIQRANELDLSWLDGARTVGLTAGASAPELLVREVVDRLSSHFDVRTEQVETAVESITFKLPRALT